MSIIFDNELDDKKDIFFKQCVTITVQRRNGKKCITNITGMSTDLDFKKILSYFKKTYNCNGAIIKNDEFGDIITLSGDQKENVYNFLINEEICKKDEIIIKGI